MTFYDMPITWASFPNPCYKPQARYGDCQATLGELFSDERIPTVDLIWTMRHWAPKSMSVAFASDSAAAYAAARTKEHKNTRYNVQIHRPGTETATRYTILIKQAKA